MGRGARQMCGTNNSGFPIRYRTRQKVFFGFQTEDIVRGEVKSGKYAGRPTGRIAVRARPNFRLGSFDVAAKDLTALQRADGSSFSQRRWRWTPFTPRRKRRGTLEPLRWFFQGLTGIP